MLALFCPICLSLKSLLTEKVNVSAIFKQFLSDHS